MAFALKFTAVILGSSLYHFESLESQEAVYQACLISLIDFFCVIIPVFLVSDTYFIKVFSAKHLELKAEIAVTETSLADFGIRETVNEPLLKGLQNTSTEIKVNSGSISTKSTK